MWTRPSRRTRSYSPTRTLSPAWSMKITWARRRRSGRRSGTSSSRRSYGGHRRTLSPAYATAHAPARPELALVHGLLRRPTGLGPDPFVRTDGPRHLRDALRLEPSELPEHPGSHLLPDAAQIARAVHVDDD